MKSFASTAALLSLLSHVVSAAVTIDTPYNVVQCQPQMLSVNGVPPFFISAFPAGQPSASPLMILPKQESNTVTWLVNLPAGTEVSFAVKDASGETGFSDKVTILQSDDTSCLNAAAVSSITSDLNNGGSTSVGGTVKTPQPPVPTTSAAVAANRPAAANVPSQQSSSTIITTVRPVAGIQAVSSSISSPLSAPTVASSGATSLFPFSNVGMAAVVTLFGTLFL